MAGTRNKRDPNKAADDHLAAAKAVAEAVEASLGEPAPGAETADGDGVLPPPPPPSVEEAPNGGGELSAPEKEGEAEAEARKLKELNAMLLKEVYERRGQVASLSARVEELSIATPDAGVEPEVEVLGEPGKKQGVKKTKKKAPVRRVQARQAAEKEKISTTAASEPADEQGKEAEADPAPGGRPRRNRKANSMYPADTWAR